MNIFIAFLCAILSVALLPCIRAESYEVAPKKVLRFRGKDVPLYDAKDVPPSSTTRPLYPSGLKERGIQGEAIALMLVSVEGRVAEAIVKASDPAFKEAAEACVKQWKYPVVKRNGAPTEFLIQSQIKFVLVE